MDKATIALFAVGLYHFVSPVWEILKINKDRIPQVFTKYDEFSDKTKKGLTVSVHVVLIGLLFLAFREEKKKLVDFTSGKRDDIIKACLKDEAREIVLYLVISLLTFGITVYKLFFATEDDLTCDAELQVIAQKDHALNEKDMQLMELMQLNNELQQRLNEFEVADEELL